MVKAYDYWSSAEQERYNPDGTMKDDFKNRLLAKGKNIFDILAMEVHQQEEVKRFEEREEYFKQRFGKTFSQWDSSSQGNLTPSQRTHRQQLALEEGADLCELPEHMEPDEYYDYHAGYPG